MKNKLQSLVKLHFDSLLFSLAGFIIVYAFTCNGRIGLSPDSIAYIGAAKSISAEGRFLDLNGDPLVDFPFFYPFFLSLFLFITKLSVVAFAPFINATLFAVVIFISGYMIQKSTSLARWHKWILLGIIITSTTLFEVYFMLWSETLFILEVLLFILAIKKYAETALLKYLLEAAFITAIAGITRYAGVALIGLGCFMVLINTTIHWKNKLLHTVIFFAGGISLLVINIIRNRMVSDTLTGDREQGITSLHQNILHYGSVLNEWFPFFKTDFVATVLGYGTIICFAVVLTKRFIQKKDFYSFNNIAALVFFAYSCFIILISTLLHFEEIDNRLLAPAFVPLILSFSNPLLIEAKGKTIKALSLLTGLTFITLQLIKEDNPLTGGEQMNASSYTSPQWKQSDMVRYLNQHPPKVSSNYTVFSNASDAAYFFANLRTNRIPSKLNPEDITNFLENRNSCLIWFNSISDSNELSLPFILSAKKWKLVQSLKDGAIYVTDSTLTQGR